MEAKQKTHQVNVGHTQYNWEIEEEDLELISRSSTFDLNMDFLTRQIPEGLGFSPNCKEWLEQLGILKWKDLTSVAYQTDIPKLMRALSIDKYHKFRRDLRFFLCFGKICDPRLKTAAPTENNAANWLPLYTFIKSGKTFMISQQWDKRSSTDGITVPAPSVVNDFHRKSPCTKGN